MKGKRMKIVKDRDAAGLYFEGSVGDVVRCIFAERADDEWPDFAITQNDRLNICQAIPLHCLRYLNNKEVKL